MNNEFVCIVQQLYCNNNVKLKLLIMCFVYIQDHLYALATVMKELNILTQPCIKNTQLWLSYAYLNAKRARMPC